MAKDQGANVLPQRRKAAPSKTAAAPKPPAAVAAAPAPPKKPFSLPQFWSEVRAEGRKITWTSWKETWITSVLVGIMVVITAIFFLAVDGVLNFLVQQLLKLASG